MSELVRLMYFSKKIMGLYTNMVSVSVSCVLVCVCAQRERERDTEREKLNKCETALKKTNYLTILCT